MTAPSLDALGTEVPLGSLDKELRALWSGEGSGTKASLINFAVYTEDPADLTEVQEVLASLTREHACRAILILCTPGTGDPSIRSFITAHCQLRDGKKTVCSEQVTFLVENGDANVLRNTLFAHLDSDLPLFFWWWGDLSDNFEDRLYTILDRFLVDSASWTKPLPNLVRMRQAMEEPTTRFIVHDLSWTRTHQLRLALASLFDHPMALERLPVLDKLHLGYCSESDTAALMFAAWMAICLKGRLHRSGTLWQIVRPDARSVMVTMEPGPCEEPVSLVEFNGSDGGLVIRRDPGSEWLHVSTSWDGCEWTNLIPADRRRAAALISEQIQRGGTNQIYRRTLNALIEALS
jgi:glucose-6-phosphate dehydrogenase assembly protein OpcA